jgi:hypothetical protein
MKNTDYANAINVLNRLFITPGIGFVLPNTLKV